MLRPHSLYRHFSGLLGGQYSRACPTRTMLATELPIPEVGLQKRQSPHNVAGKIPKWVDAVPHLVDEIRAPYFLTLPYGRPEQPNITYGFVFFPTACGIGGL